MVGELDEWVGEWMEGLLGGEVKRSEGWRLEIGIEIGEGIL
jgi:hypothetical protein